MKDIKTISSEIQTAEAKESAERTTEELQVADPKDIKIFEELLTNSKGAAHENSH